MAFTYITKKQLAILDKLRSGLPDGIERKTLQEVINKHIWNNT